MSNLLDRLSLEDKIEIVAMAVSELLSAAQHNKQVDDENYQHVQDMQKAFKELQNTVTRLTNTYLVVSDDLIALTENIEGLLLGMKIANDNTKTLRELVRVANVRIDMLEAAQFAELGDGK